MPRLRFLAVRRDAVGVRSRWLRRRIRHVRDACAVPALQRALRLDGLPGVREDLGAWRVVSPSVSDYEFPLPSMRSLVERVEGPLTDQPRRWVLRDDNQQHYHGRVPLAEDPLLLELSWKADARSREQVVGLYRLHLAALLARDYIRLDSDSPTETHVRLRFHRGDRSVIHIQAGAERPALAIGTVDRSLG